MGEIKSTLELVMEKTKGIAISEDEKREMKKKEILQKATALSNRYREGQIPLGHVLKEIEKMEEKTATEVRELLLSQWIDGLSLSGGNERLLEGIEVLGHREIEDVRQEFRRLLSECEREREEGKMQAQSRIAEILRQEGIEGSAVEPNPERSDLWQEGRRRLDLIYGKKLQKIKNELRTS